MKVCRAAYESDEHSRNTFCIRRHSVRNRNVHNVCLSGRRDTLRQTQPIDSSTRSCKPASRVRYGCLLFALSWLLAACRGDQQLANNLTGGNYDRGHASIRKYGCGSCHTIPGVVGAHSKVGPDLSGLAGRAYIAGVLTNSPDNLMSWIENPQAIDDKTAMPNMGVSPQDARDIAAYLYTLR